MDANKLKQLSDDTFFDNDEGLITPETHREFNNQTIDFIQAGYTATYIVDSDAALKAWANNTEGNDYSHVLIKPGTYTSSVGIKLKDSGTKTVVGMGGNLISFVLPTTTTAGISGHGTVDSDCYIMGVNIQATGRYANGFGRCCNLIRCTATVKPEGSNAAFWSCRFLSHCSGFNTSTTDTVIYSACNYLTNCYAKTNIIAANRDSHCFYNCNNCLNCFAEATANRSAFGFFSCKNLTNCTGNAQSENEGCAGFYNCTKMGNCLGGGNCSGSEYGYGFYNCIGMSMCAAGGFCKTAIYSECYMLSNKTQPVGETADGGYNWMSYE